MPKEAHERGQDAYENKGLPTHTHTHKHTHTHEAYMLMKRRIHTAKEAVERRRPHRIYLLLALGGAVFTSSLSKDAST